MSIGIHFDKDDKEEIKYPQDSVPLYLKRIIDRIDKEIIISQELCNTANTHNLFLIRQTFKDGLLAARHIISEETRL
jgi:hypothetical protein